MHQSMFRHQEPNDTQSPFKYQEGNNTQSPFEYQGGNNTQSSVKYQGDNNTQSSVKYQEHNNIQSPVNYQGGNNTQSPLNYQERNNTQSPFKYQGGNNTQSPFKYQGGNNTQSPFKYQERNNRQSPVKYQRRNNRQSSVKYQGGNNTQSPFKYEERNNTQSPFKYQERNDIQSPFKYQGHNDIQSPFKYQERNNRESPFKYQERNITQSPVKYQEPNITQSPVKYQGRNNRESPFKYQKRDNTESPFNYQNRNNTRSSLSSKLVIHHCNVIRQKAAVISSSELTQLLNELMVEFENFRDYETKITNFRDIIDALSFVPRSILPSIGQHNFFTLLHLPFFQIIQQWNNGTPLTENESVMFKNMIKLSKPLLSEITDPNLYPPWLSDPALLDAIATCFRDISKSIRFFDKTSERESTSLLYLLETYDYYQKDINNDNTANPDKLVRLLSPVIECLTSQFYLDSLNNIQTSKGSMSKKDKFFLVKCPTFLTNYNGTRLEETMNNLLSTMLPKYIAILDKLVPLANKWNRQTTRAVTQMFKIVNHGPTNGKIVSDHLPFIDHILKILDVPKFHNSPHHTLSNRETNLVNTAVSLLVKLINEPKIVTHIKQKHGSSSFLRLTSAEYEPLIHNVYTLLAYTTTEDDIKSMHNPGILLSTIVKALQTTITEKPDDKDQIIQLLETLKGLVQHDQMKEEILKQDLLSFLVECSNQLNEKALPLLFETLWSMSYSQDIAQVLRSNSELLAKIQTISKNTGDEALKKATDGLIWKLVKEPEFLEKVAKRQAEEGGPDEEGSDVIYETIIGEDGKEQVVTKTKRNSIINAERVFQYDMMISYCHADKDLIIKIHQFLLDEGFKIWIDLNNMFGPAMSAMAEAVENSEFVILCMSDSYKQSTYCQAEAEYAFACKRRLLPLIVRPGYRADGWLGFMIGSRIYIDFGTFDFPTACDKMLNEISRQRKRPLPSKTGQIAKVEEPVTVAPIEEKPVEKPTVPTSKLPDIYMKREASNRFNNNYVNLWMESDVLDFLFTHNLHELMPLCEHMDGPALMQLYKMCASPYNRTYNILNDELKSTHDMMLPIGTYTRFLSIMGKLIASISPKIMLRPPAQLPLPLMPPPPPPRRLTLYIPPPPAPPRAEYSNGSYDILITSNASVPQVIKMVGRASSRWKLNNSTQF